MNSGAHFNRAAGAKAKARRRLAGGAPGYGKAGIEGQLFVVERFEQQIKGHHFGQGRREVAGMDVDRVAHLAAIGIDNHGSVAGIGGGASGHKKQGQCGARRN